MMHDIRPARLVQTQLSFLCTSIVLPCLSNFSPKIDNASQYDHYRVLFTRQVVFTSHCEANGHRPLQISNRIPSGHDENSKERTKGYIPAAFLEHRGLVTSANRSVPRTGTHGAAAFTCRKLCVAGVVWRVNSPAGSGASHIRNETQIHD